MRPAKRFLLCQTISAELQRLITRHSREERFSQADFHVTVAAGEVMTFFLRSVPFRFPLHELWKSLPRQAATLNFFEIVRPAESPGM